MPKIQRFSVTLGLSVCQLKLQVYTVTTQFLIKYPAVNIKRSSGLPCLILYAHFKYFNQFLVVIYVWISSSNSLSQTTGTKYKIRTLKKDGLY